MALTTRLRKALSNSLYNTRSRTTSRSPSTISPGDIHQLHPTATASTPVLPSQVTTPTQETVTYFPPLPEPACRMSEKPRSHTVLALTPKRKGAAAAGRKQSASAAAASSGAGSIRTHRAGSKPHLSKIRASTWQTRASHGRGRSRTAAPKSNSIHHHPSTTTSTTTNNHRLISLRRFRPSSLHFFRASSPEPRLKYPGRVDRRHAAALEAWTFEFGASAASGARARGSHHTGHFASSSSSSGDDDVDPMDVGGVSPLSSRRNSVIMGLSIGLDLDQESGSDYVFPHGYGYDDCKWDGIVGASYPRWDPYGWESHGVDVVEMRRILWEGPPSGEWGRGWR